jgi:glutaredoxin
MAKEKILFTSKGCGACGPVKKVLKEKGVKFKVVSVDNARGSALADKYDVKLLPSMVIDGKLVEDVEKWTK